MHKLTIHQAAERDAHNETAAIADSKRARASMLAAYSRAVIRLAQDVDSGKRQAWAGAGSDESAIGADHLLMKQLRDWLKSGPRSEPRTQTRESFVTGSHGVVTIGVRIVNEEWKKLFIADDAEVAAWPFMNRDHQNFAPELEAAVSAWIALYGTGESNKRGAGELVPDWLTKHRPEASKSAKAKDRITAVVTPEHRKTGGAMPSGKK